MAIYDATGIWVNKLPVSREEIVNKMMETEMSKWLTSK